MHAEGVRRYSSGTRPQAHGAPRTASRRQITAQGCKQDRLGGRRQRPERPSNNTSHTTPNATRRAHQDPARPAAQLFSAKSPGSCPCWPQVARGRMGANPQAFPTPVATQQQASAGQVGAALRDVYISLIQSRPRAPGQRAPPAQLKRRPSRVSPAPPAGATRDPRVTPLRAHSTKKTSQEAWGAAPTCIVEFLNSGG